MALAANAVRQPRLGAEPGVERLKVGERGHRARDAELLREDLVLVEHLERVEVAGRRP